MTTRLKGTGLSWTAAVFLTAGLVTAACSSDTSSREPSTAGDDAVAAAEEAAAAAAGGERLDGTVSILGVLGGEELDAFQTVLDPFERATGVDVQYEGTRDFAAVLQTRLDGGNPPQLAVTPAIGEMAGLAQEGALVDLRPVIGDDVLAANYNPGLIETGTVNGQLFGLFNTVNLDGLVWYDPNRYDGPTEPASWDELQQWAQQQAGAGESPWCVGLESGAASGWPAADFIDEILLRQAGPEFHQRWRSGAEPWTSPPVRAAFETYGETVTEDMVYGGATTALSTSFTQAATPMLADPPGCYLLAQASFMGAIVTDSFPDLVPGEDLDFFPVPDFTTEYPNLRAISGEVITMLEETPQSAALVRYLASAEAATLVAATGRWLSPNQNVDAGAYEDYYLRKANQVLTGADGAYSLGNALMPQAEVDAFWQAGLSYTERPEDLDAILRSIQDVR